MNKTKQDHRHHGGQDQEEGHLRGPYWRKVRSQLMLRRLPGESGGTTNMS